MTRKNGHVQKRDTSDTSSVTTPAAGAQVGMARITDYLRDGDPGPKTLQSMSHMSVLMHRGPVGADAMTQWRTPPPSHCRGRAPSSVMKVVLPVLHTSVAMCAPLATVA